MAEESKSVPLTSVDPLGERELAEVAAAIAGHWTLKTVLDWCLAQTPPILNADVVTQDEFTHDLIVPLPSGTYLVYDST
jgi:hypothetical protein